MEQQFFLFIPVRIPEILIQGIEFVQKPTIAINRKLHCCSLGLICPALERQNFGHLNLSPWKQSSFSPSREHHITFYNLLSQWLVNLCVILLVALIKMRLLSLTFLHWRNLIQCIFVCRTLLQYHFPLKSVSRLLRKLTQWFWSHDAWIYVILLLFINYISYFAWAASSPSENPTHQDLSDMIQIAHTIKWQWSLQINSVQLTAESGLWICNTALFGSKRQFLDLKAILPDNGQAVFMYSHQCSQKGFEMGNSLWAALLKGCGKITANKTTAGLSEQDVSHSPLSCTNTAAWSWCSWTWEKITK